MNNNISKDLSVNEITENPCFNTACENFNRGVNIKDCIAELNQAQISNFTPSQIIQIINFAYHRDFTINKIRSSKRIKNIESLLDKIAATTEASKVAILLQLLTALGNVVGRNAYITIGAEKMYPNLFCLIVGNSSKARKGTSLGIVKYILKQIAPDWSKNNIISGIASGEGLIHGVRDQKEAKGNNKEDPGVTDKRKLIIENEFVSVLNVSRKKDSTVSSTIRDAWDGSTLQNLSKNFAEVATAPHISIIGHITEVELKKSLNSVENSNGFANRFLICKIMRERTIPFPIDISSIGFHEELRAIKYSIDKLKNTTQFQMSSCATSYWEKIYPHLAAERFDSIGPITARSEAQTLKLSLLLAVIDSSPEILAKHIEYAFAIWKYCEGSCHELFSNDHYLNPVSKKILNALKTQDGSLTRSEILKKVLNGNYNATRLNQEQELLITSGYISICNIGGAEIWTLN